VLYFDADVQVFGRLDDLGNLARHHGIVITPHTTEPMPRHGWRPTEREILQVGVYNAGFVGLGASGRKVTDWWSERPPRDGIRETAEMLFTDQRWLDFVPGYFRHHVVRDPLSTSPIGTYTAANWANATGGSRSTVSRSGFFTSAASSQISPER
jgi:hypothetical protein